MTAATVGLADLAAWLPASAAPQRREGVDFADQRELEALAGSEGWTARPLPGWVLLTWRALEDVWRGGRPAAPPELLVEAWRAELQRAYWRGWDRAGGPRDDGW